MPSQPTTVRRTHQTMTLFPVFNLIQLCIISTNMILDLALTALEFEDREKVFLPPMAGFFANFICFIFTLIDAYLRNESVYHRGSYYEGAQLFVFFFAGLSVGVDYVNICGAMTVRFYQKVHVILWWDYLRDITLKARSLVLASFALKVALALVFYVHMTYKIGIESGNNEQEERC